MVDKRFGALLGAGRLITQRSSFYFWVCSSSQKRLEWCRAFSITIGCCDGQDGAGLKMCKEGMVLSYGFCVSS